MRRILRKIVAGEGDQLGDTSTLAEPEVVDAIKDAVKRLVALNDLSPFEGGLMRQAGYLLTKHSSAGVIKERRVDECWVL